MRRLRKAFLKHAAPTIYDNEANWLDARLNMVTASDAAVICGYSNWCSILELWAHKTRRLADEPNEKMQEWWAISHDLEPAIAAMYARKTGRAVIDPGQYTLWQHNERLWQGVTLDRLQVCKERGEGILELKTCEVWQKGKWHEEVPDVYMCQIQHQMDVLGLEWGSLAVLIGCSDFRWFDIERDDQFIAEMRDAEEDFWACVQTGEEPTADGSDSAKRTLARMYPVHEDEKVVQLPAHFIDLDSEREDLADQISTLTKRKNAIDNQLKQAIGDAQYAYLPNAKYSLNTVEVKAKQIDAYSFRKLHRSERKD